MDFRVGDWVEVRSAAEILATLDSSSRFEGVPFMPQMVKHCGRRYQVSKSAHKLCDTVNGTGGRSLAGAVFLADLRCDGASYGGCEMECLIFWKTAWLKPASEREAAIDAVGLPNADDVHRRELQQLAERGVQGMDSSASRRRYSCQATELPHATKPLSAWSLQQYVADIRSGNSRAREVLFVLFLLVYRSIADAGLGVGSLCRWGYDAVQRVRGGTPYPFRPGTLPKGARTPTGELGLSAGDLVQVKTLDDILSTVNANLENRGMSFHPEMAMHCAGEFRVEKRLRRLINEKTGELMELKNPCIVLENTPCVGLFTKPLLCPRGMAPYWREVWLQRPESPSSTPSPHSPV